MTQPRKILSSESFELGERSEIGKISKNPVLDAYNSDSCPLNSLQLDNNMSKWFGKAVLFSILVSLMISMFFSFTTSNTSSRNLKKLTEMESFTERKSWFRQEYYEKFKNLRSKNGLIFSAIQYQREDPAQEPLIFLIFSRKIEEEHISFARDLGRIARRQNVVEFSPSTSSSTSRKDFGKILHDTFSQVDTFCRKPHLSSCIFDVYI